MTLTPFITTTDLSNRLGRDVSADAGAISAVDSACQICRTVAEQDFNAATGTISIDGTGTDCLLLPQRPVGGAGTVVVASQGTITDYMVTSDGMLLRGTAGGRPETASRPVWPTGRQNVTVTFDHGYASLQVPSDVCEVALNLAMRAVVQGVAQSETIGDVSVSYKLAADDLNANELRILHKYRGPRS
jgi:hypothetical protein